MLNRILNQLKPKTLQEVEQEIIDKQKEQSKLKLMLEALKSKKEIDNNLKQLQRQINNLQ